MNLEFLTKQQAISFFNKQTNLDVDKQTFLIYCLENKVSIKYKAITDFEVIMGYFITDFEYKQLRKHQSSEVDLEEVIDDTIFCNGFFEEQHTKIAYKFFKENFPEEYSTDLALIKMNALNKSYELVQETDEYKELLNNKKYLDALKELKTALRIVYLNEENGAVVFHTNNKVFLKSGIYEFLDNNFEFDGLIKAEMKGWRDDCYSQSLPSGSRFLIINNLFYFKAEREIKGFENLFNDSEIFHQCFLKSDIDMLVDVISSKVKKTKDIDILHSRTANNASKIISALCELNELDLTQPYGQTNKEIMSILDKLGTPLSKDVVGDWLKLAHENTK